MIRFKRLPIGMFIGALGTVGVLLYFALTANWLKIETLQVDLMTSSHEDLLYQRIKNSLTPQLQRFAGKFFWQVSLAQIYDFTVKDKRVRKATVFREFPSRVRIMIEPQTPVLAYLSNDYRVYPVAADATLLPSQSLADASDLPILRGEELRDENHLRELALDLFEQIPNEGSLRKGNISEIYYVKKDGFKIFMGDASVEIKMGEADFGPKISRVEMVLSYLDSQNIKGRVIDARFAKKVVVRVRNSP
jgi:cell division septal protein FtsQ